MRLKLTRFIPEGYKEFKPETGDYPKDMFACFVKINNEVKPRVSSEAIPEPFYQTFSAMFYTGKQSRPTWHYKFRTEEEMKKKIFESISRIMSWEEKKAERKVERKKDVSEVKVGDIFYRAWGYDQTNINFYQVIETKGQSFTIREICAKTVEGSTYPHGMADEVVPVRNAFMKDEEPIVKRSMKFNSYSWLSKTEENKKHYRSWYA